MGKKFIDIDSLQHFLGGFLSFIFLKKFNFNIYYNFFISNGLHLLLEIIEHNTHPNGKILETNKNHYGDILFFGLGWIISYKLQIQDKIPNNIYIILNLTLIIFTIKEFTREFYPYSNNIFIKGAFIN